MATITETKVREGKPTLANSAHLTPLAYRDVADLIQPYPENPQGFDDEYLNSLPSRWGRFAQAFREVSDEAGQFS